MTPAKRETYIKYCTKQMIDSLNAGNNLTAEGWRRRADRNLNKLDPEQARKLRQTDIKNGRHLPCFLRKQAA